MPVIHVQAKGLYLSLGNSSSKDQQKTERFGFVHTVNPHVFDIADVPIQLSFDYSTSIWENLYGDDIKTASIIPMFSATFSNEHISYFVKFGIGLAYINQTTWGKRELGDNWIFEDKLEIGAELCLHHSLALSLSHYSNAATNNNNDGSNIFSIVYMYQW